MEVIIQQANEFLENFGRVIRGHGYPYTAPWRIENEEMEEVSLRWDHGQKGLEFFVDSDGISYVRWWGERGKYMEDGDIRCEVTAYDTWLLLWHWLWSND